MKKSTLTYKGLLASASVLSILGGTLQAKAATLVDIELALVVDGSGSISQQVFDEHIAAIDDLFNDENFYEDFVSPLRFVDPSITDPSIAVGFYQFGTVANSVGIHEVAIEKLADWTLFNQENQSKIDLSNVQKIGGFTPIADVIQYVSEELLSNNDYEGYKVINSSTDGFDNSSTIDPLNAARKAFRDGITINALALPSDGNIVEGNGSGKEYDEGFLRMLVDPYSFLGVQRKNFDGDPAFLMLDYATGEKTLADALRLKVAEETTGFLPVSPLPPEEQIQQLPEDNTEDPTTELIVDPSADPENIPEPSSLLGLLTMGVWSLYKQYKKG